MFVLVIDSSGWGRHRTYRELARALYEATAIFHNAPKVLRVQVIDEEGRSFFELIKATDPDVQPTADPTDPKLPQVPSVGHRPVTSRLVEGPIA